MLRPARDPRSTVTDPAAAAGPPTSWQARLSRGLAAVVHDLAGLDLRSLAVMRMGIGLILLRDLIMRAGDVLAFHADKGALPRAAMLDLQYRTYGISIHMGAGHPNIQLFFFAVAAVFAVMLLVGYRTRLATIVSWALLCSVQTRAPIILQSGDVVLRLMLFWSLFLPLGARYSLDNLIAPPRKLPPSRITSVASAGLILQFGYIYLFTALLKSGRAWIDGSAVYYALSIDYFAKQPFCNTIVQSAPVVEVFGQGFVQAVRSLGIPLNGKVPWLASFFTYSTLLWEYAGPALLLFPWKRQAVRAFVVMSFIFLHLGFFVGLEIGLFPWICIVGWLGIMPGAVWDKLGWVVATRSDRLALRSHWAVNIFAMFCLVLVTNWNIGTVHKQFPGTWRVPSAVSWVGHTLRLDQNWVMFAPYPLKDDGWYVMPGVLFGGEEVDLWGGGEPTWVPVDETDGHKPVLHHEDESLEIDRTKPEDIAAMYKNQRWRKYMRNLWSKKYKKFRLYYGKHVCREWNAEHRGKDRLKTFRMVYMKEVTPKPGGEDPVIQPVMIWRHNCYGSTKQDGE